MEAPWNQVLIADASRTLVGPFFAEPPVLEHVETDQV
jgi:hypothetical protein